MRTAPDYLFKALADPTRREIYEHLVSDGELTVRALTDRAGVSQPAVSKHLGVLKKAELVRDRPEGRQTYYRADREGLAPLIDWIKLYAAFWTEHVDRLERPLEKMDQ
jgi:DNA-binding transcriptional ArsR family regulator